MNTTTQPANDNQIAATPAATAELDALTRRLTMFKSFAGLLAGGEDADGTTHETSYVPSIYPQPCSSPDERRAFKQLADAYDAAQALRGDPRKAHRGDAAWWVAPRQRSRREVVAILAKTAN